MKCMVCDKEGKIVEFEKACSLGTHLWKTHGLKPQQYYDTYLKSPGDGKCAECGSPTLFRTLGKGYLEFCSKKCAAKHIANDSTRNAHKSAAFVHTMQEKYNVENPAELEDVKWKRKLSMREKYGVDYYSQVPEFKDKAAATMMERYGVRSYIMLPGFQEKLRAANMARFGVPYQFCTKTDDAVRTYTEYLDKHDCDLVEFRDKKHITYRCRKCGHETTEQDLFLKVRDGAGVPFCTACHPKCSPVSGEETSLRKFVESLGFTVDHYDRGFIGPYGADIVVESRKLIIEFDGLRWHSELCVPDEYHLRKTELAAQMGYRLIHVFSDEWEERGPIVESRIKNILGIYNYSIGARECRVKSISNEVANNFADAYHIQGSAVSSDRYGLYNGEELCALMTFGKARFERDSWELIRYCIKPGYRIPGAAGKLFSRFLSDKDPSRVITYADRRWSGANAFYGTIGFEPAGVTEPGYSYVVGNRRVSRLNFQKHKLVAEGADSEQTEHEIMYSQGIYRIYDCGNYKYVWVKKDVK